MESSSSSVTTAGAPTGVTPGYDDRIVKMFFTATVVWFRSSTR